MQHALGGLVIQRHNKVWDCLGDMAVQVWSQVVREPIVKEAESKADSPGLRADLGIRGPQVEALFDVKVIDTDAKWRSGLGFDDGASLPTVMQ